VYVHSGTGGGLQTYAQNGAAQNYASCGFSWVNISDIAGWMLLTLPIDATYCTGASWDPTQVMTLGIKISAGPTGPWASPTVVYLDSVVVNNGATDTLTRTFDADLEGFLKNQYQEVPGSEVAWLGP
jgi:hypothetical protein